jgi:arylsulfatase A-like enzyme
MNYDAYIANVDAEFGRLVETLQSQGALENTYIVVTSDHGESFERGFDGHISPLLFEPLTNIPLLIAAPGQQERQDIFSPTSCVDVLPTLLSLANQAVPAWCEGQLLPGLGGNPDSQRSIFSVEAATNPAFAPLKTVSVAMRKGNYKLTYYSGYQDHDIFELYDLEKDPEELVDLYAANPAVASLLKEELLAGLQTADTPYQRK